VLLKVPQRLEALARAGPGASGLSEQAGPLETSLARVPAPEQVVVATPPPDFGLQAGQAPGPMAWAARTVRALLRLVAEPFPKLLEEPELGPVPEQVRASTRIAPSRSPAGADMEAARGPAEAQEPHFADTSPESAAAQAVPQRRLPASRRPAAPWRLKLDAAAGPLSGSRLPGRPVLHHQAGGVAGPRGSRMAPEGHWCGRVRSCRPDACAKCRTSCHRAAPCRSARSEAGGAARSQARREGSAG
jgi:hypothetical protein